MERLTNLKVAGFRSIKELDLELKDLNVLIGANGSGKSNFVALFNLVSHMLSGSLQLFVARKGGGASALHYGPKRTPLLSVELHFEERGNWSEYACTLAHASPDRLIFTHENVRFQRKGEAKPFERFLASGQSESDLPNVATGEGRPAQVARVFLNRLKGLRVYHFHDTSEEARIRTSQEIDRNRMLLSNGGNLAAFLYMLREAHPQHYHRIVSTVRLAVPYLKDFELEPSELNSRQIQLRWHDRNPDYEFGAHQLSDGSMRAIALITALMQPETLLPSVMFIDEPELGLHPSALAVVGDLLKAVSKKRQVVVATQSPKLLAACSPDDVIVVEREEDDAGYGQSVFKRLTVEDLGDWLKDYDLGALYEMNVTGGGPR